MLTESSRCPSQSSDEDHDELVVGVLGGMGSMATAKFLSTLIEKVGGAREEENVRTIVYCNPKIPSRSTAFLKGGVSPAPEMIRTALALERGGADFVVIPCVSAHYWHRAVADAVNLPMLNIVDEVVLHLRHNYPEEKKFGLLAATQTIRSKLFIEEFQKEGLELQLPDEAGQETLMHYLELAKNPHEDIEKLVLKVNRLLDQALTANVHKVIFACTELAVILQPPYSRRADFIGVDASDILAQAAVDVAKRKRLAVPCKDQIFRGTS